MTAFEVVGEVTATVDSDGEVTLNMANEAHVEPVAVEALARRLFVVLLHRGIGFGTRTFDELSEGQQEVYRNDARVILLMQLLDVTEVPSG